MAKDIYHEEVKRALIKDGWTITHDPYILQNKSDEESIKYQIDLGAEKLITAEKGTERIAIEIKSFLQASFVSEFHSVIGKYIVYEQGLQEIDENRILFLAIPDYAETKIGTYPFIQRILKAKNVKMFIYNIENEIIVSWIK
jgi:hypothetical protein